ncbi:cytochrome P450 [Streptomyces sp. NPDC050997]|uniref:cytochrome P450 n=1 Tax=Streptomyces sp. NPDC050997 TaxID=3155519 RepID=UPI0034453861
MTAVGDISGTTTDRRAVIALLRRLRSPEGQSNPLPVWDRLRALGDVVPAPWGGYLVTGYDACNQILRGRDWLVPDLAWQERQPHPERWQDSAVQAMSRALFRLNAPSHTCQRRGLGNLFDRHTLDSLAPRIADHARRIVDELAERIRDGGEADFVTVVGDQLPVLTVGEWLDIPARHHAHILDFTHRQVHSQELLPTKSELAVSEQATVEMREFFTELIAERRAHPGDDAVSGWIRYWDEQFPDDPAAADRTVYDLVMFITIASLETSATLMATAVWLLTRDGGQWEWLRQHPEHVEGAVEEALRYDPPVHINTRIAADDTVLAGTPIARDQMVHVMYGAAAHDPRRNEHPERFDVLRGSSHMTFGGGIHYCLGAALARLEGRTLLNELLNRFQTLRPVSAPAYAPRMVFRRVTSLKVTTDDDPAGPAPPPLAEDPASPPAGKCPVHRAQHP